MANINVKRVDLTKRYEDKDLLIAPRTILDQVAINGSHNPETGEDIPGIDNTPAFIYDGKKPKNLNDALKNLAENVKGSIGSSGILQIKRGPDGTPEDPDTSGIYTFPVATDTELGIITKADVKQIADDEDDVRDAKRPTVANKVMTGVAADGTGEYYDLGTKLTAPSANKVFTGFKGGDVNDPQWESIKTTVAPKPFTGTWTDPITGEVYGPDNVGLATSYIDKITQNIKIYEQEGLNPDPTNTYTGVRDDTEGTITITIPKAEGKVKDVLINNTSIVDADGNAKITVKDTYDAAGTDAISGKGVKDALDTLDVAEVGEVGKYIQKIKQEDGKITATLADVKDTYTATDIEPISGKGVADMLENLKLDETGGDDKIITMVKQEDGVVTATEKKAVEKAATPADTNAYEYIIAEASVKVEMPKATDAVFGEVKLDKDKIDSASTAKTDDPILMTGKAIEDSLAVKKVNGNDSIYAYNATVPTVDKAVVLGSGASATAEGAVVVGTGASAASKNDVAIGTGAATADDSGIAIGENATAAATKAISVGLGAQARSESSIAIGTAAKSVKEAAIAVGSNINTTNAGEIAIGQFNITCTDDDPVVATALTIGDGDITKAHNLLEQKANTDLYIPGIGHYDGTNSSPYDYELNDDGTPKLNNDGNPIKKVRPLQESIVEDVVMKMPKDKGGIVLNDFEVLPVDRAQTIVENPFGANPLIVNINPIPSTPPTVHLTGPVVPGCSLAWCMYGEEYGSNTCIVFTMSSLGSETYSDPMDIPFPVDILSVIGVPYETFIGMLISEGFSLGFGIFGNDDAAKEQTRDSITLTMVASQETEEVVIGSGNTFSPTLWGAERMVQNSESRSGFTSDNPPVMRIKNAGYLLDTYPDAAVALGAIVMGQLGVLSSLDNYPTYIDEVPDPDNILLPDLLWGMLPQYGVDTTTVPVSAFIANVPDDADLSGITYEFIVKEPKIEYEDKSIVKEHIAHLPFIDAVKSDSNDYDVPNVKAIKQVRKEIEDEIVFTKGSGALSIQSKIDGAIASGQNSFAVGANSRANGTNSVAINGGTADGQLSIAMQDGQTNGENAIAIGVNAKATNANAMAIGDSSHASGEHSVAIGRDNNVPAHNSYAVGTSHNISGEYSAAFGHECDIRNHYSVAAGYYCTIYGKSSTTYGQDLVATNDFECVIGTRNAEHKTLDYALDDSTRFAIGIGHDARDAQHPRINYNLQEATDDGKLYIYGIGNYDGIANDTTKWGVYKKNADGTDYINPLTNKKEHEYYKPVQEVIELMEARIKYLEDIVDELTQQRNPVEP